jgi:gamma-glutamyl hercynylcysteine S-oxide synthase
MSFATMVSSVFGKWTGRELKLAVTRDSKFPAVSEAPIDSRRLIRNRRYCLVLSKHGDLEFDDVSMQCAWRAFQHEMAFVPGGSVRLMVDVLIEEDRRYCLSQSAGKPMLVDSFYFDRDCVTNADYARFVQAGGYDSPHFWPQDILPFVLQFVDGNGNSGPRFWLDGKPPADKLDHPVVGICWYEANAYARWAGKRLPTTAEWQRAGTWSHCHAGGGAEQRYPWGNAFEHSRANIWTHNRRDTVPVDALVDGNNPNGIRQLIGNVWEWVDTQYTPANEGTVKVMLSEAMAEVRGGAFDTYFASQASCQFRTGQPIFSRPSNVGFRCCVSAHDVTSPSSRDIEVNNS